MNNDIIFFKEVVFLDLNKKVAFVTGASIGLGKGLIEELSKLDIIKVKKKQSG